ncbi:GNAT family N-acetyltransferase [Streptomyces sp. M10(2022)]
MRRDAANSPAPGHRARRGRALPHRRHDRRRRRRAVPARPTGQLPPGRPRLGGHGPRRPREPPAGRPLAYLIADRVDDAAHIEQISVDPAAGRRGIGRLLIGHLAQWAAAEGLRGLTLTTFADVPWNAPYYTRLGFRTLGESEIGEGLRGIRAQEAEHGLDRWPRVCMRREL